MADKKKPRASKNGQEPTSESIRLEIEMDFPKELVSRFANHAIIQRSPNETYLSFFEVQPPVIQGTPEQMERQRKELKSVRAVCVARLIMTDDFALKVLKMLQDNLPKELAASETDPDQGE
jgi:hypothetical protein